MFPEQQRITQQIDHVLQSYDPDDRSTVNVAITKTDDNVTIAEIPEDTRCVLVEQSGGTIQVRVYAIDRSAPIVLRLPETGGVEIDRHDYDLEGEPDGA